MHHIRSWRGRAGCFVLINGLLSTTVAVESATAQPLHPTLRRQEVPPALHINPDGVPPAQSPTRVPYSDASPGISVNPNGAGAPQSNYPAVPFPAATAPPYTALPPSGNGNPSYVMSNSICATPAGSCTTYQTQGTQCRCSDGIYLYFGVAQ
jgi:hypothetical protein